jgi:hypothetical protein
MYSLEQIQSMSHENKKRVLIVSTIVLMVIIVAVWAVYFNSVIMGSAQVANSASQTASAAATTPAPTPSPAPAPQAPAVSAPAAPAAQNGPGIWTRMANGIGSIGNMFSQPSNYTIQPK